MKKKLFVLVVLTAALITLTSCGTADDPVMTQTEAESVYEIAVSQEPPDPPSEIGASSNGDSTIDETLDELDVAEYGQETEPLDYQHDDGQETVPLDYQHDDEQAVIYTYVRDTDYVVTIYDRAGEAAQIPYRFPEPFLEWFTGGVRVPGEIIPAQASLVNLDGYGTQGLLTTRDEVQDGSIVGVGRIFYLRHDELYYKDIGVIRGAAPMHFMLLANLEGRLVISGNAFGRWSYTLLIMEEGKLIYDFTLMWDEQYGYYFMCGGMSGQEFDNWESRVAMTEVEFNEILVRYGLDDPFNLRIVQRYRFMVASLRVPLSATEAHELVSAWVCMGCYNCERECFESVHVPELDKQEDGVYVFGFAINFSGHRLTNGKCNAYAWVNSLTGETRFEEGGFCFVDGRNLYANIPDSMFPIPMRDGVIIPYDRFSPPNQFGITYWYSDSSVAEIYNEQLRNAGFDGGESAGTPNYIWRYDREAGGVSLTVVIYLWDGVIMHMFINFLDR